jgi:hypothetical protein
VRSRRYTGQNLVFIVGCPRSGTTWLQKLLASHPKVHTGEESHYFSQYVGPQLRFWNVHKCHEIETQKTRAVGPGAYFRDEEFLAIVESFLRALLQPMVDKLERDEIFVEKTPSHALYIAEIKQLLPDCRFINIVRDPRAVVASLLAAARTWGADWAPRDPRIAAAMWVQHVQAVRDSANKLSSAEFYELKYENLWQAPEEILKDVMKFLGLAWNEHLIYEAIQRNRADLMDADGTPIPVYGEVAMRLGAVAKLPQYFVRYARPDSWKRDLSFGEKRAVWKVARKTMEDAGYSWHLYDWA